MAKRPPCAECGADSVGCVFAGKPGPEQAHLAFPSCADCMPTLQSMIDQVLVVVIDGAGSWHVLDRAAIITTSDRAPTEGDKVH